ncbi:VanZ family protein [Streptomyces sp. NBC_01264]|uniref:VanZ family protein n=1 Tax=Streptomyces sp. NBC_01264 TaxID=2903804 RepID=UPI003D2F9DCA
MTWRHALRRGESPDSGSPAAAWQRRRPVHPAVRALAMVAAFIGTVLFSVVLARLTLEPSAASVALVHSNTRPGHSINAYLDGASTAEAVRQLGGNLLLGLPFGVLLPVLMPPARGLLRVALVTVCLMTLVELIQGALVTGRVFDIDDVILNTTGALLGYLLIGRRLGRAVHPRRRHWWHRRPRPDQPAAATGPVPEQIAQPEPKRIAQRVAKPATKPTARPKPTAQPTVKSATKSATKPGRAGWRKAFRRGE